MPNKISVLISIAKSKEITFQTRGRRSNISKASKHNQTDSRANKLQRSLCNPRIYTQHAVYTTRVYRN